jgi:hypothetical protein
MGDHLLAEAVSYPPNTKYDAQLEAAEATTKTPICGDDASASARASASASASPNPSDSGTSSRLNNGRDDVNCSDLPAPVKVGSNNEDNLDSDGDGTGCE